MAVQSGSSAAVVNQTQVIPALRDYPAKVFVETTTRCNLHCHMCVKQTPQSGIVDGDLSLSTFTALESALPHIESLILNGIGEPLLNPALEAFIHRAKQCMPPEGRVGFQSNGLLLDQKRARSLVAAGLDKICLSVDALDPEMFRKVRKGGDITAVERAFSALQAAASQHTGSQLEIGIEFVLRKDTMFELPNVLRWAASRGVSFAIVTHMISYEPEITDKVAYDRNTDDAVAFFEKWQAKARQRGINIPGYFDIRWKYSKNDEEQRLVDFVDKMMNDATDQGIFFHIKSLLERDETLKRDIEQIFKDATAVAVETGLDLSLPSVTPKGQKKCDFIEAGSVFVSWRGDIHPCYFLWHQYSCFVSGWHKYVSPKVFGNLSQNSILDIWNDPEYRTFRETVIQYDYPLCSNCNLAPCDYLEIEEFEQDCYTNTIPCCDCQWCLGVFQCLQ